MPRARNIKPGLTTSETLARVSVSARYLFVCLPMYADCEGRLEDRPMRLCAQIFPYDADITGQDVDDMLNELAAQTEGRKPACLIRYTVEDERYIQIVNFQKHQNPVKKERDAGSQIPPVKPSSIPVRSQFDPGTEPVVLIPDSGYPDSGFPKPDSGYNGVNKTKVAGIGSILESSVSSLVSADSSLIDRLRKQVTDWASWGLWYTWACNCEPILDDVFDLVKHIEDAATPELCESKGYAEFENPGRYFVAEVTKKCKALGFKPPSLEQLKESERKGVA